MDIISRRSGPRPEDEQAKRHLKNNWGTIEKLADTLSGGSYSKGKAKKVEPQAQGLIFVDQSRPRLPAIPQPYLRISANGRVVLACDSTGVQLHFLGQLKRVAGEVRFVLATAANGFLSPLDTTIETAIADLADRAVNRTYTEDDLARDLRTRLAID